MMKLNIISYSVSFFMMIMVYSPFTFAPWSYERRPSPPIDGLPRTCPQWLNYHGFTLDNYNTNRELAQNRAHMFDMDAFIWAAIYAYVIDEKESSSELLPNTFCEAVASIDTAYSYEPLKNEVKTCRGWITLYQFQLGDNNPHNVSYAKNRSPGKNYAISIWVDSYSSYLVTHGSNNAIGPTEFCSKIGKHWGPRRRGNIPGQRYGQEIRFMEFMSEYVTSLSCYDWIELYEFYGGLGHYYKYSMKHQQKDDIEYNYKKAIELIKDQSINHISVQYWVKEYCNFLQTSYYSADVKEMDKFPRGFCRLQNQDDLSTYNFHYDPDEHKPFEE